MKMETENVIMYGFWRPRFRDPLYHAGLRISFPYFEGTSFLNRVYLNPKSMQKHAPKPIIIAIKAIILPTLGVQVVLPKP